MKTLIKAVISASVVFAAFPVLAAPMTYDCAIQSYEKHGWISPRILVFVDHDQEVAGVMDSVIASTQNTPMIVPYDVRSKQRMRLTWTVNNIDARSGSAKASYSATLDERRMKLSISARVHGWDNRPAGSGPCKRSNIKLTK
ncbi:hypothetical protein [Phaeobacter sp. C3_T13_0]|uniref:hypothetical protein n=1 Tax=Phaeobacter cretensis TaxID=3342641 RepID=UPI0039BCBF80